MPVLITGAEDALGQVTARRMLQTGGEIRLWFDVERTGEADVLEWRASGFKAAIGESDDEGRLEAALEQVHTVIHLAGGALHDPAAGTDALATLISAALGAGCRRLIWVTDLALAAARELQFPPAYVAALAERARLVAELPLDVVVLRTGLRFGPGDHLTRLLAADGGKLRLAVPHAPVWIDDVAAAVLAADSQRGAHADVHLVVDLVGPEMLPLAMICNQLAAVPGLAAEARGAPNGVPAGADVPGVANMDDVVAWLRVPAVGDEGALGTRGRSFSEGVAMLRRPAW